MRLLCIAHTDVCAYVCVNGVAGVWVCVCVCELFVLLRACSYRFTSPQSIPFTFIILSHSPFFNPFDTSWEPVPSPLPELRHDLLLSPSSTPSLPLPQPVQRVPVCMSELSVQRVSCGQSHTLVTATSGQVWACGYDRYGQVRPST